MCGCTVRVDLRVVLGAVGWWWAVMVADHNRGNRGVPLCLPVSLSKINRYLRVGLCVLAVL